MKKCIAALIIVLALLCGCGEKAPVETPPAALDPADTKEQPTAPPLPATDISYTAPQGFLFEAYGQDIYVCAEAAPILGQLPEPKDTFEQGSCAFEGEGMDITYFYPGFELTTYAYNDKDYVLSVVFTDDSVTTPLGVYIGGTSADIKKAYGADFTQKYAQLIYTSGQGSLIFTLEDDIITGIVYTMIIAE